MRDIDPAVTFVSPSVVTGKSSYINVLNDAPIHSEDTKLKFVETQICWTILHQFYHPVRWRSIALQHSLNSQILGNLVQIPRPHYVHHHSGCVTPRSITPRKFLRSSAPCAYLFC
ncbi:hypothetical protein BDR03DRAFT_999128 [Suillus americanus]|nr:hypothetical protein BDR03DRAFT_999128 [Suillus americanus]